MSKKPYKISVIDYLYTIKVSPSSHRILRYISVKKIESITVYLRISENKIII